jgi:hypothetical protein
MKTPRTDEAMESHLDCGVPMDLARQIEIELHDANQAARDNADWFDSLVNELAAILGCEAKASKIIEASKGRQTATCIWRETPDFRQTSCGHAFTMKTPPTDLAELQQAWRRYEYLRTVNPRQFTAIWQRCLKEDLRFDYQVDLAIDVLPIFCKWREQAKGCEFATACGHVHVEEVHASPSLLGFTFCPYCGKTLREVET